MFPRLLHRASVDAADQEAISSYLVSELGGIWQSPLEPFKGYAQGRGLSK